MSIIEKGSKVFRIEGFHHIYVTWMRHHHVPVSEKEFSTANEMDVDSNMNLRPNIPPSLCN